LHLFKRAQELLLLAKQGTKGIAQAMLPYMPDGLTEPELEKEILNAKPGRASHFSQSTST
jgi:hypothetical protein